jgi:hypothetical protein
MKLTRAFGLWQDLWYAVPPAILPTLQDVMLSPSILLRPQALSHLFFARIWVLFGNGVNENGRAIKDALITPNAYGVVLDIGAGYTIFYDIPPLLIKI